MEGAVVGAVLCGIATIASLVIFGLFGIALNIRDRIMAARKERRETEFLEAALDEAFIGWDRPL